MKLRSEPRESSQRAKRAANALAGVPREAQDADESIQILDRREGDHDPRHLDGLQLVERDRLTRITLLASEMGPLPGAGDHVQHVGDGAGIGVGLIQGTREERSGKGSLLHVDALGQARELGGVLGVQGDVETGASLLHGFMVHDPC